MFKVIVADNYHYQDQDSWSVRGKFETEAAAVLTCQQVVRTSLEECGGYAAYTMLGDDPFIVGEDGSKATDQFSAWDYARSISEGS